MFSGNENGIDMSNLCKNKFLFFYNSMFMFRDNVCCPEINETNTYHTLSS